MTFQSDKVLKKLVRLLNDRNFITRRKLLFPGNTEFISYKYGPPGALLRNNLITNWRKELQFSNNNEPCFFVENPTLPLLNNNYYSSPSNSMQEEGNFWSSYNYIAHSLKLCAYTLSRTNVKLPFTIARIGVSYQSNSNNEKIFLFDSNEKTNLSLLCFCSPDSSGKTFETLLQQRLQWWQQFPNFSSNFQLMQTKNVQHTHNNNNNNNRNKLFLSSGVQYHFPWGWNTIEKTTLLGTTTYSLTLPPVSTGGTNVIGDVLKASVVVSNVTLEKGLLALLYDSYQERTNTKSKTKQPIVTGAAKHSKESTGALKLHSILSPYKVGVAMYGNKSRHLRQLAQRVIKDLKTLDLQIFGSVETVSSLESQRIASEQIGVLYMVIISDKSLETGFTKIKNHERKEQEELVHVSDIKEYLIENLKLATFHKSQ